MFVGSSAFRSIFVQVFIYLNKITLFSETTNTDRKFKMSRRKTNSYSDIQYQRLNQNDNDYLDSQFQQPSTEKIPWKSIGLAAVLCLGGLFMLTFGSLIVTGHLDTKFNDRMWPMIIIGALMFIPGVYHIRIALYAYKQYPGFSFNDIPSFD